MKHRTILLAVLLLCARVHSQIECPSADDGFAGACCTPVTSMMVNLPAFPDTVTQGTYYCTGDCYIPSEEQGTQRVTIANWTRIDCTHYSFDFYTTGFGALDSRSIGSAIATYQNTWTETNTNATPNLVGQVWRFHVNFDVVFATTPNPNPCPIPICAVTLEFVNFDGTIEFYCGDEYQHDQSVWKVRYDIHHMCDVIHHRTSLITGEPVAPRPGPYHPAYSYHLVGPNPVSLSPLGVFPSGTEMSNDSEVRTYNVPTFACWTETAKTCFPLGQDITLMWTGSPYCRCFSAPPGPGRWNDCVFSVGYACGMSLRTVLTTTSAPSGFQFAGTHPVGSITTAIFPAGRTVLWFYGQDDGTPSVECSPSSWSMHEFITGVRTSWNFTGVVARYFRTPASPCVMFTPSTTNWIADFVNHNTQFTATPSFGAPTWGSWMAGGIQ